MQKNPLFELIKPKYYLAMAFDIVFNSKRPKYALRYLDSLEEELQDSIKGFYLFRIKDYRGSLFYLLKSVLSEKISKNFNLDNYYEKESAKSLLAYICFYIGIIYLKGLGVKKDPQTGIEYLKSSLDLSNKNAAFEIGEYYYKKHAIPQAKHYFKIGISLNETRCMMRQATILYNYENKNFNESVSLLKKAAIDLHDNRAYYELGKCFLYQSYGATKNANINLNHALDYFKKAYESGIKEAKDQIDLIDAIFKNDISNNSISFMYSLSKINNSESLYNKIKFFIENIFSKCNTKPNNDELNYFIIGIFDAVINSKFHKDWSLPILSLEKGLSSIIKERIIRKYKDYLKNNNLEKEEEIFIKTIDKINIGEVKFTLDNFNLINHTSKKTNNYHFKNFVKTEFNLDDLQAETFINSITNGLDKIKPIRNDAAHGLTLNLESFEQCLDVLFFKDKILINIFKHIK